MLLTALIFRLFLYRPLVSLFFSPPPSLPPPPPAPLLLVLSRCSLFLFLIVNSTRSFRRLTTAVTRSYLAEISAVETLWFSTNAKTERLHGHGKRAGIKRKIKRRITLFHVYRTCTGEQPLHFRIYTVRFFLLFFFSFFLHFYIWEFLSAISKDGRSKKKGTEINSNRYTYTFHNREGGVEAGSCEGNEGREREEGKLIKRKERWFLATDSRKSL